VTDLFDSDDFGTDDGDLHRVVDPDGDTMPPDPMEGVTTSAALDLFYGRPEPDIGLTRSVQPALPLISDEALRAASSFDLANSFDLDQLRQAATERGLDTKPFSEYTASDAKMVLAVQVATRLAAQAAQKTEANGEPVEQPEPEHWLDEIDSQQFAAVRAALSDPTALRRLPPDLRKAARGLLASVR
jgi:hypothetical protein